MRGPFDVADFRFSLPANWTLQGGAEINLVASSFFASNITDLAALEQPGNYVGALLDVYFNGNLQQSIPLRTGEDISYQIPISVTDLESSSRDGSLEISFFLNASIDCDSDFHHTTVMISPDSLLIVDFLESALQQDLRRLPWPIYQARAQEQSPVFAVVPSSPSDDEMQAALITMATFGRMTRGDLPLTLISENELSDELLQQANIIFIGKPQAFSRIGEVNLPISFSGTGFSGIQPTDGILQQAVSPWNQTKTILVVSGNENEGVVKAAQALSTENILTGDSPSYSIVTQINPQTISGILASDAATITSTDVTLGELGYDTETLTGIGTQYLFLEFFIPPGQRVVESPALNLEFSHSTLIDSERSEGVVYINDVLVGGFKLLVEDSNAVTAEIQLPVGAFRSGVNSVDLAISLIPRDICSVGTLDGLWVTISQDSLLHLPLVQESNRDFSSQDLYSYPYPFASDPALDTTAFVLPENEREAWTIAGALAFDLGSQVAGPIFLFETAFDEQLPDSVRDQNLILIGQPINLSIVSELEQAMPAYFEAGSNIAILESQQVVYRISPDKDLGYLEVFPSPWAEGSLILGVFGTTPTGLINASLSLLQPNLLDVLRGNFATIDGEKSLIVDTRTGLGLGRISPELGTSVTVDDQPTQQPVVPAAGSPQDNKLLIMIGLIVTVALMVVIVIVAFWLRRRNL